MWNVLSSRQINFEHLHPETKFTTLYTTTKTSTTKDQLISKADWRAVDSPKKWTDKFDLFVVKSKKANKTNSFACLFVYFVGKSKARQSAFGFIWPLLLYFRYNVVILLATYIFPIIAIGLITIHMTIVLWWRQPFSVVTPQLERAKSKKQKVTHCYFRIF